MEGKLARDAGAKRRAELGLRETALFPAQPKIVNIT